MSPLNSNSANISFRFFSLLPSPSLNSNRRIRSVFRFSAVKMSHTQNEWRKNSSSVREVEWREKKIELVLVRFCLAIAFEWIRLYVRSFACVSLFKRFRFSPQNVVSASLLCFAAPPLSLPLFHLAMSIAYNTKIYGPRQAFLPSCVWAQRTLAEPDASIQPVNSELLFKK